MLFYALLFVALSAVFVEVRGATKNSRHAHNGILIPYDNKHIPYAITLEQNAKLDQGDYVTILTRSGKSGRGVIIQDVHSPPNVCMDRIRDLANYHKMVPNLKSIEIFGEEKFANGTVQTRAKFNVGISLVGFGYYLVLTFEPKYNTYTWTLDYQYNSDFDDNTGHWQVVPHPTKEGWSRVLYSTEVKLFSWIPEFVVTFLTKTALISSTTWVKRESEKIAASGVDLGTPVVMPDLRPCYVSNSTFASYETHCAEGSLESSSPDVSPEAATDATEASSTAETQGEEL